MLLRLAHSQLLQALRHRSGDRPDFMQVQSLQGFEQVVEAAEPPAPVHVAVGRPSFGSPGWVPVHSGLQSYDESEG